MSPVQPIIPNQLSSAAAARSVAKQAAVALLVPDEAAQILGLKPKTLAKDRCTREIGNRANHSNGG
ncbi:hypothetical protein [Rhizobacter sp. Root16D2]|uniref:hypothetical protein n=1 Tax=Rhizobacter sp. Root16D2 TaxID=1736479 RepID=UPI000AFCD299|nr:hypothetical protein [Rhizobacter sp. Root16D2]